jgi:molybdopterin converting factor small subunit
MQRRSFWPFSKIRVRVKLFTGLHREVGLEPYDPEAGIAMEIRNGARIRTLAKALGLPGGGKVAFFVAGQRVGPWHRLKDGDEVACMKPSAGG